MPLDKLLYLFRLLACPNRSLTPSQRGKRSSHTHTALTVCANEAGPPSESCPKESGMLQPKLAVLSQVHWHKQSTPWRQPFAPIDRRHPKGGKPQPHLLPGPHPTLPANRLPSDAHSPPTLGSKPLQRGNALSGMPPSLLHQALSVQSVLLML